MLQVWDAVEADFLRDYHIILLEHIDKMSWRYFLALVRNLSPYGAVAARVHEAENSKEQNDEKTDEEQANSFFSSVVSI